MNTPNLHLNASYRRAVSRAMELAANGVPACVYCLNPGSLLACETYFVDEINASFSVVEIFIPKGSVNAK